MEKSETLTPFHYLLLLGITSATFMEVLDISITNVSIPTIAGELGVTPFVGVWVISSYALGNSCMILLSGFLAKRFGLVRTYIASIFFFIVFSTLCGLAFNFHMLVISRVLQGMSAGPIVPLSQTLLLTRFPSKKKGTVLGIWTVANVVAPLMGPILGGFITEFIGWRWIFWINIPIGTLSLLICFGLLRKQLEKMKLIPVDVIGVALLIGVVASIQIAVDKGNELGWFNSPTIIALVVIAVICLCFFIPWVLTSKHPVVDLHLFRHRNFALATSCVLFSTLLSSGALVVYPLWLETVMGYTPIWAGYAMMFFLLLIFVTVPIVDILMHRFKVDLRIICAGAFLTFAIFGWYASLYTTQASFVSLIYPRLIAGIGLGGYFTTITLIALSKLSEKDLPGAASIGSFMRIFSVGMGASLGAAIVQVREKVHYDHLLSAVTNENRAIDTIMGALQSQGFSKEGSFEWIATQVKEQSTMLANNDYYILGIYVFIVLAVLILLTRPPFSNHQTEGAH
ncbi:MAG: Multidrug export protein EmrB [Chlamydiales bacterium]|nr:Multidrug export protein EmrB [Chlamydiales bacterium]MCH9619841.1 Multidrug export protein EmrB [Chlamydiales bacterium]MCH9622732.1 Multidrug export protein EmrB [Chlamydiales bacterium]